MCSNTITPVVVDSEPHVIDDDNGLIRTNVAWLARIKNPLLTPPWGIDRIHAHEVLPAAADGRYAHPAHPDGLRADPAPRPTCRECDIARIAYFTTHGWPEDDPHPIEVDVGLGTYIPQWPIIDGNHRLAAALIRNDTLITVSASGDWDRCLNVFVHGTPLWDLC